MLCTSGDPLKVEHLKALKGAAERLHLYKADLLDDGCFDSIVDGCECVFHTASPVLLSATACNPQVHPVTYYPCQEFWEYLSSPNFSGFFPF